jgi:hypothetical protein
MNTNKIESSRVRFLYQGIIHSKNRGIRFRQQSFCQSTKVQMVFICGRSTVFSARYLIVLHYHTVFLFFF